MTETRRKVLLIDDEKDILEVLQISLTGAGFVVEIARNGFEGLKRAKSFRPDIILLDMVMPDMEGWEVCRRLKAEADTRKIPVIIMTARQIEIRDCEKRALSAGASRLLVKPFEAEELFEVLGMTAPGERDEPPLLSKSNNESSDADECRKNSSVARPAA